MMVEKQDKETVLSLRVPETTNHKLKLIAMARDMTAKDILIELIEAEHVKRKTEINAFLAKLQ